MSVPLTYLFVSLSAIREILSTLPALCAAHYYEATAVAECFYEQLQQYVTFARRGNVIHSEGTLLLR